MRWRKDDYEYVDEKGRTRAVRQYLAELDFGVVDRYGRAMGCFLYVRPSLDGKDQWVSGIQAVRNAVGFGSSHSHRDRRFADLDEAKSNAERSAGQSMERAIKARRGKEEKEKKKEKKKDPTKRATCAFCETPTPVSRLYEHRFSVGGRIVPLRACRHCRYGPRNVEAACPYGSPLSGPFKGIEGMVLVKERDPNTGEILLADFRYHDAKTGTVKEVTLNKPRFWED